MEPTTGARIAEAFWFSVIVMVPITLWIILGTRSHEDEPIRWHRLMAWLRSKLHITSSNSGDVLPDDAIVPPVANGSTKADNGVATRNNADNAALSDNEPNNELDNAIFRAKVEALAALVRSRKVPMAEGIETVFDCTRQSKPDSVYQRARAMLLELNAKPAPIFPPMTEEQAETRKELKLDSRPSLKEEPYG